ncbi:MAG: DUF4974 domain-containing protein [Chloroflexia bacterium]|nr:DUF4974 domain-containing protein [Chloroflexia bacterium]
MILEEIERQYDVVIDGKDNLKEIVTRDFSRGSSLDDILNNIIGRPSGIKFEKVSKNRYRVIK